MSVIMILQVAVMVSVIIMSVLGNLLVMSALHVLLSAAISHYIIQVVISVLCNRTLRQPPNLLLLSLAVTDLLVSLLVMPGALSQHLVGYWPGSSWLCLAWVFSDVFLCTSSILSLTAICIGKVKLETGNNERLCIISKRRVPILTVVISIIPCLSGASSS